MSCDRPHLFYPGAVYDVSICVLRCGLCDPLWTVRCAWCGLCILPPASETLPIACIGQEVSIESLNWVMVVEYMDRAQGPTVDFLLKTFL